MDEKKKLEIQKEAKEILAKFSNSLQKVKFKERKDKKEVGGFRKEGSGMPGNSDFRKRMFENFRIKDSESARESGDSRHAPEKDGDYIIAEKKSW